MAGDRLFRALARPQMVAGVTYPFFVLNGIVAAELFLIFKSLFALLPALLIHALGYAAHLRDPHVMALWLTRLAARAARAQSRLVGRQCLPPVSVRAAGAAKREKSVGDHLPYLAQIDDHTILTRDGLALQVIRLEGLPFETIDAVQLEARKAARDAMLQAMSSARFALVHHVVRRAVAPDLDGEFGDPFSAALDKAWRDRLAHASTLRQRPVPDDCRPSARRAARGAADKLLGLFTGDRRPKAEVKRRPARTRTAPAKR